jgi:uncharacterized membrane protein (UPF0127 family)
VAQDVCIKNREKGGRSVKSIMVYRNSVFFRVMELAVTPEELVRGLLGRKTAGSGLFLMGATCIHTYGMSMAIDAVYLNKEGVIIGLEENIGPNRHGMKIVDTSHIIEFDATTVQKRRISIGECWCWRVVD